MNKYLEETEKLNEIYISPDTPNYSDLLMETFRLVEDPFNREIEQIGYERTQSNDATSVTLQKHLVLKEKSLKDIE